RERHVQDRLAPLDPFEEAFERKRRLPGAGSSFDKIKPVRGQSPTEDVVEPCNAGLQQPASRQVQWLRAHLGPLRLMALSLTCTFEAMRRFSRGFCQDARRSGACSR